MLHSVIKKKTSYFFCYSTRLHYLCSMNLQDTTTVKWSENVIIADADYVDHVAFDLTVNFERMLGRRVHTADISQWAVCVALDGGLRPGEHETQLVLVHNRDSKKMDNFKPSDYETELNAKAFKDEQLGEFLVTSLPVEDMVTKNQFMVELLQAVLAQEPVKRIMVIPNADTPELYDELRHVLKNVDDEQKRVTLFAMQPMMGGNFRQEILGYSLLSALGISADEIK